MLSPFLFTTYTADFKCYSGSCHLQKFSDDMVIVGRVECGREEVQGPGLPFRKVVWGDPPAAECGEDERDSGGLQEEQAPALFSLHWWDRC